MRNNCPRGISNIKVLIFFAECFLVDKESMSILLKAVQNVQKDKEGFMPWAKKTTIAADSEAGKAVLGMC